jgi:hypothetical protein
MSISKLWKEIKKWFRKHFGKRDKTPNPVTNFTVEIEDE